MGFYLRNRIFNYVLKKKPLCFFERNYSLIASVNINNWDQTHKEILQKIKCCDFISIDIEYTGLHLKDERYVSVDASYEAHCYGAQSFFPCQIGLTVAKKIDFNEEEEKKKRKETEDIERDNNWNESNKKRQRWEISSYSIYVFPKENKYFKVSTTTLIFLRENNFDFNEWIFKGVSYLTPIEENEKKKFLLDKKEELQQLLNKCNTMNERKEESIDVNRIIHDIQNNKIVDEEDKEPIVEIIKKIDVWFNKGKNNKKNSSNSCNNNTSKSENSNNNISPCNPNENTKEIKENERKEKLNDKICDDAKKTTENELNHTNIQDDNSKDSLYQINKEYDEIKEKEKSTEIPTDDSPLYIEIENPYLRLLAHTLITKYFHSLFCISIKVNDKKHLALYKTERDTYKEQIKNVESEIEKINKTIGVRLLFDEIIKRKKVIIGHNCFYDILHIYQTFYNELPKTINEFKEKWTQLFPYTFDTKFMNETNEHLQVLNSPATLKGLCEYMGSLISIKEEEVDFFFQFDMDESNLPSCFRPFIRRNNFVKILDNAKEKMERKGNEKEDQHFNQDFNQGFNQDFNHNCNHEFNHDRNHSVDNESLFKSDEHNAGYDSLLTCLLFIFQCHHILKKNNLRWSDVHFYQKYHTNDLSESTKSKENNECDNLQKTSFFEVFSSMANKIKLVKTQPNVISLISSENSEMDRHFYMYDYPSYFKKWEIMKIWSPLWITLSKVDDQSCWIIAKSDEDAKNIKMIYKMLQNPQFKLCTYEEYLQKFKSSKEM